MDRVTEAIRALTLAIRCSFSFCWRNSKKETIGRLVLSLTTTILFYSAIQAMGFVINAIQKMMAENKSVSSFNDLLASDLLWPIILSSGVLLLGVVIGRFNWYFRSCWHQVLRFANQQELNDHRATLDVGRFRSKAFDDLAKRIQELPYSWQTRIWFSEEVFSLFAAGMSFALFGASLLWYKPAYALIIVLASLPMIITEFQIVALWWNLFQELVPHHKKRSVLEKPYHETTSFVQALMFNQMPALHRDIDINVKSVLKAYDQIRKTSVKKEMVTHLLAITGLCGVIIHAIWSTVAYAGEIGTLTILISASRTFQGNLETIVGLIADQWNNAKGVVLIEKDFLGLQPLLETKYPVVPRFDLTPTIRFDHVSFTYPGTDRLVLDDVNLIIRPGSKVAIVGKSGHGKSTLLALLMRHYDPDSGDVLAEDISLRNIEPSVWNNVVSALTQDYRVLERSVSGEIASSRLESGPDLSRVIASSQFANFDIVVADDPLGYNAQIGTQFGGREFSGGENQRIALARAHYRGTPILVLDEPDAKLDPESAERVMDQIFALEGVTVVIITHHVSRAERCDEVIVMDKGRVAEKGTHDELISAEGLYASMYEKDQERLGGQS